VYNARGTVALAAGRLADAQREFGRAIEAQPNDTDAVLLMAHAALWTGDVPGAAAALAALVATGLHTPAVEARSATVRAGLAAGEGRRDEALALYRDALRRWRELGFVLDEALTAIDMATLLDPAAPEVRAALDSAREILTRVGAGPFLARLEAAMGRIPSAEVAESAGSREASTV
jgi:tetratricopeptide (TPR) repeat protein